jgi:hypothetical protein
VRSRQPAGIFRGSFFELWTFRRLTSRWSQPPLAVSVPPSRFTSRVGGGSAFCVRHHRERHTKIERLNMNIGLVGGIVGSVIGCVGGFIGAYCSYKAAKGPRERRFVIWASIALVVLICSFLVALFLAPQARAWIWTCYIILLSLGIRYLSRRQSKIQQEEQTR